MLYLHHHNLNIRSMKKYLKTYAPSLGELWFIMLALVCVGGALAGGGVAACAQLLFHLDPDTMSMVAIGAYPLTFCLAIPFIYMRAKESYMQAKLRNLSIPEPLPPAFGKFSIILFFLLLLLLVPAFSTSLEPLTMWLPMPEFIKKIFESLTNTGWVTLVSVVIMAPLFEEWLLRKVALGGLLKRGYSPAAAILWSALMFGVIHMNPWQAIPGFLTGILFGWVYWRTRSLWAVIFMHAVNNGGAFLLTALFPELPEDATMLDVTGPAIYPWVLTAVLIVSALIIWLLHKNLTQSAPLFQKPVSTVPST